MLAMYLYKVIFTSNHKELLEVSEDLSICVLMVLPEVSTKPCVMTQIYIDFSNFHKTSYWSHDQRVM